MAAWLDNLIPLKAPRLDDHRQLAGWRPKTIAMQGLGCRLLADQRIPVDDGVSLSADVYRPKQPGRHPAIVQFAAYSRELHTAGLPTGSNEIGAPPIFTDRGYAQVVVSRRGMDRSGGEAGIFLNPQDVDDHARCIAWAAEQPWCDGNVVLFGTSYYGLTQLAVAERQPPALKAFFCNEVTTDYFRHIWQFGGVFGLYFCNLWMGANFTEAMYRLRMPPVLRALVSHITNSPLKPIWQRMMMKRVDAIYRSFMRKTPIKPARAWYANWMIDGKTRERNLMPEGPYAALNKIEVPFVVVQNLGYFNLHQFGCYDLFENAGTPADRKWMILGPAHYELPVYDWQLEALAFFDHILRNTDNGYAEQPPVRYWLDGDERYVGAQNFPIPGSEPCRFYLASGGIDAATHALTRNPPADGGANSWAAIPIGVPVLGGFDEVANQMLTYEWRADEDVQFAGPVSAYLSFSCNEIDSHVVARLGRVASDGTYHHLSMGTISPARRRRDPARGTACEIAIDTGVPEPLTPGEPVSLAFSLTPGPTRLKAGETLRLDIASRTDLLKSDVSHGHVHFDIPAPPYFSRNTVHYGPQTYLELHRIADPT
jgi:putative CocE/NonD family hydrolase